MTRRVLPCIRGIALIAAQKKAFQRRLNSRQYSPPDTLITTDTTTPTETATTDTNTETPIPVAVATATVGLRGELILVG